MSNADSGVDLRNQYASTSRRLSVVAFLGTLQFALATIHWLPSTVNKTVNVLPWQLVV